jgi:hypothetical protein
MLSIDTKNTFPDIRCRRDPLRKNKAAKPESKPRIAAQIWTKSTGESAILMLAQRGTCNVIAWNG